LAKGRQKVCLLGSSGSGRPVVKRRDLPGTDFNPS
jgi:hypothetical protein